MALLLEPGAVVVGNGREVEAGLLGALSVAHQSARAMLFGHQFVAELDHGAVPPSLVGWRYLCGGPTLSWRVPPLGPDAWPRSPAPQTCPAVEGSPFSPRPTASAIRSPLARSPLPGGMVERIKGLARTPWMRAQERR